jgi:GDP-L-fucose synthase
MRIYVAGHNGLVGSAVARAIIAGGLHTWFGRTRSELDLFDRNAVFSFIAEEKPDAVVIAAARVGGIVANNSHPVEFLTDNLLIETNLLNACHAAGIERVLFLGSSCIYPRLADQPIKEEALLTGPLEPTNESYALSKIAGIKLVQAYRRQFNRRWISAMPTNLYGPNDNFDLESSHVLPAMIRKFHDAKVRDVGSVELWGTGSPRREFLHVDDLASACLFLLEEFDSDIPINVGVGNDVSIKELAELVRRTVDFNGEIRWNTDKPDGTPRKLLDVTRLNSLGWEPTISLEKGIAETYEWFCENFVS